MYDIDQTTRGVNLEQGEWSRDLRDIHIFACNT